MKKIAIIGASYLQVPLIIKAKSMNLETHVFAWKCGDEGETIADYFYPISTVEKEKIFIKCQEIGIDGICSIASDLATITVNYVAEKMGLIGNSYETTNSSTNKFAMKQCFFNNKIPSARFLLLDKNSTVKNLDFHFPVIVKPTDRSGSRGITKVKTFDDLAKSIENAKAQSFEKKVLVEEFINGQEYSVEFITFHRKHYFLALTKKFTTGEPHFIETGHVEPTNIDRKKLEEIKKIVCFVLDSIGFENGASHTEIKIDKDGKIYIIEIGGRMGGDLIGSSLVPISTGIDFVKAVIQVALNEPPDLTPKNLPRVSAVRFVFSEHDILILEHLKKDHPELLVDYKINKISPDPILDSSNRYGYFLMQANDERKLRNYLPNGIRE